MPTLPPLPRLALYLPLSALAVTGMIAGTTISAIAADRMLAAPTWSGLPVACSILGTASGSRCIAAGIRHLGLRWALAAQYTAAVIGSIAAVLAVFHGLFLLLCGALALLGVSNGATQYVRYLAADGFPRERRAAVLSWVVWMGSIGAVVGPSLLAPSGRLAQRLGLAEEAGPFLVAGLCFSCVAAAYASLLRERKEVPLPGNPSSKLAAEQWPLSARLALLAMIIGHVVMVLVMTMTPVHLTAEGHGLGAVGLVISSHTAGMFLFSPVFGWLTDRTGPLLMLRLGAVILLVACGLAALMAHQSTGSLHATHWSLPLFLLGIGWNIGFVAGSAFLSASLPEEARLRGRAAADSWVWIAAAAASLSSSLLFGGIGYGWLAALGAALSLGLLAVMLRSSPRSGGSPPEP